MGAAVATAAAPQRILIPYKPRKWAIPMHASFARWFALVMHRRGGKTTSWLNHHQRAATNDVWETDRLRHLEPRFQDTEIKELLRERIYAHVLPTLTQARSVAWEPLKYISRDIPGIKANEKDMSIRYPGGPSDNRIVRLFGADNIDALRGFPLSGLSLDEFSQHPPGIFGEVLSKSLADHLGYCAFLGTIKGKNQLYQTYEAAKHDPSWFSLWQDVNASLATEEGGTITAIRRAMQDDLDLIKKGLMTQEEYDQEWFLSPFAAIKGAYYAKQLAQAIKEQRIRHVPYDPALKVHDVWDLGKGPNMSVGLFQRFGREVHMIDYVEGSESDGIPQVIRELQRKPYIFGKHFAPHDIQSTDLSTGKTRYETARQLGWEFETVPELTVADGINAGQLLFPRLWINADPIAGNAELGGPCWSFIQAIGQYRRGWDEHKGQFKNEPVHDWACVTADTLVLTRYGTCRIMDLPVAGEVLTPCGWKRYQHPRITRRDAPLVEVAFADGLTVRCTPEHRFLTPANEWIFASDLRPGSLIQSSLTRSRNISRAVSFVSTPAKSISRRAVSACTSLSGSVRSGLSRAAARFTTAISALRTMPWPTWNASLRLSMPGGIDMPVPSARLPEAQPRRGIDQKPDVSGTSGWPFARKAGRNGNAPNASARTAGKWSRCWSAGLATLRNIARRPARALRIASVTPLPYRADVWCLTVPDGHWFSLANGAVTHNSHPSDMFRYAAIVEGKMTNDKAAPKKSAMRPPLGEKAGRLAWMG